MTPLAALQPSSVFPLLPRYRRASDPVESLGRLQPCALAVKRCFDVAASLGLLLVLAPLLVLLGAAVSLDSPGGPFFCHRRIGLHGRTFWIFKLRTMRRDAHGQREQLLQRPQDPQERLLFKDRQDPRVTRLGRWLRKYSLDELPQLLNVLQGDMSLVGPRPLLIEDFREGRASGTLYDLWIRDRHRLWPGITGLWQVSGRSELSFEESMRLDLEYVRQWNLRLELRILAKTLPAVLAGRGAY